MSTGSTATPSSSDATLDLGCGEGRLARDLAARGHRITGVDASATLLRAATEAHADGRYVLADAAALPFEDPSSDLVVAYNSLMDIQDMPAAVREAGEPAQHDDLVLGALSGA
jgi:ubiquinone/menaquinone biosynthesis C-methylase UbiE